jgi:hypothetical protein
MTRPVSDGIGVDTPAEIAAIGVTHSCVMT